MDQSRRAVWPSTGPPSAASASCVVSAADSGWSSRRGRSPSFHSAVTASGVGSPLRSVTTTVATRPSTSWCTRKAETSSSRCPSSIPTTTPLGPAPASRAAPARRTSRAASASTAPTIAVKAPSGSTRADAVAAAHLVVAPRRAASASTSLASRVFPTPAAPASTTPPAAFWRRVNEPTICSSSSRPTSGHASATRGRLGMRRTSGRVTGRPVELGADSGQPPGPASESVVMISRAGRCLY
jgi:hypothetical protein